MKQQDHVQICFPLRKDRKGGRVSISRDVSAQDAYAIAEKVVNKMKEQVRSGETVAAVLEDRMAIKREAIREWNEI